MQARRGRLGAVMTATLLALALVFATVSPADARTDTKSKPVILVHGYNFTGGTNCSSNWSTVIASLKAQGFTGPFIRVSFYGADTNCDVNLHSYGSFADRDSWKAIAKALSNYIYAQYTSKGIAVDVVGHSMGGLLALLLARRAPRRIRSLALLCTFADGALPTRFAPWMLALGLKSLIGSRQSQRRAFLDLVVSPADLGDADPDALAARFGELFGRDLADRPPIILRQLRAIRSVDVGPFLGELRAPTLVVSGGLDRLAPPIAGKALAAGIPGARYVELPTASHGLTITQAATVNALLREHFDAADRTRDP